MLQFPRLVTNPWINSSSTSGLALAIGREASFIPDVSFAVAEQFRSFQPVMTISQVGLTPMFSMSRVVLTLSTIGLLCLLLSECFLFVEDRISRGHDKSGNCSLAIVILAFGLGTDEGAYLHVNRKQTHRRLVM